MVMIASTAALRMARVRASLSRRASSAAVREVLSGNTLLVLPPCSAVRSSAGAIRFRDPEGSPRAPRPSSANAHHRIRTRSERGGPCPFAGVRLVSSVFMIVCLIESIVWRKYFRITCVGY